MTLRYNLLGIPGNEIEYIDRLKNRGEKNACLDIELTTRMGDFFPSEKQPYWRVFLNSGEWRPEINDNYSKGFKVKGLIRAKRFRAKESLDKTLEIAELMITNGITPHISFGEADGVGANLSPEQIREEYDSILTSFGFRELAGVGI